MGAPAKIAGAPMYESDTFQCARRSLMELRTTHTEDMAIAAEASIGLRSPKIASGIMMTL